MELTLPSGHKVLIDRNDLPVVSGFAWYKNGRYASCRKRQGMTRKTISMHRLLMSASAGEVVDHINGNGLDNRRSNLRICSPSENSYNRKAAHGEVPLIGVSRSGQRWASKIEKGGHVIYLGEYESEIAAAAVYNAAAIRLNGCFAGVNSGVDPDFVALENVINRIEARIKSLKVSLNYLGD